MCGELEISRARARRGRGRGATEVCVCVDFVVIGSGIVGLLYVLDVVEVGEVVIVMKVCAFEAATTYA